jgi:formamidopyrimidine-DNA glycosylase
VIKSLLLDQGFAAGVGNWIADEVLYQAGIDPRRRADTLSAAEARRLRTKLVAVVRKAVAVDARKERFPRGWLFHRRWGRDPEALDAAGRPIEFLRIGGRTTAWVPAVQS